MKITRSLSAFAVLLFVFVFMWGCAKERKKPEGAVLARVDGEYITADDLKASDISLDTEGKRLVGSAGEANKLDLIIERKAMLHHAMKLNLHKAPEFLKAIQKYWEYALLSKMLEQKKEEIDRTVTISDQELNGYAEKMCYRVKYRMSSYKDKAEAESFAALCASSKETVPMHEFNVSGCEGIDPALTEELFQMKAGDLKVIKKGDKFLVVKMLSKDNVYKSGDLPPREEVRKYALEMKKATALDEWIDSVVEGAKVIKYNNNMVTK